MNVVDLNKRAQSISSNVVLTKSQHTNPIYTLNIGWDMAEQKDDLFSSILSSLLGMNRTGSTPSIDIDVGCIVKDVNGKTIDIIYFGNKNGLNRSIWLNHDNITGDGDGDDETIFIDTERLPKKVNKIIVVVNVFSDHSFSNINNAYLRIDEEIETNKKPLFLIDLSALNNGYAAVIGELEKSNTQWIFKPNLKILYQLASRTTAKNINELLLSE